MTKAIIGLLHSTKFTDEQETAFRNGIYSNANWSAAKIQLNHQQVETDGHYGPNHDDLKKEAKKHHGNGVHIIAAAGGLVSALAASRAMTDLQVIKPIVFLIGRTPQQDEEGYDEFAHDTNLVGGVDLGR